MKPNELSVRHFSYKLIVLLLLLLLTALFLASCKTVAPSDLVYSEFTTATTEGAASAVDSNAPNKPFETNAPDSTAADTTASLSSDAATETVVVTPDTAPESVETFSYEYPAFFAELVDRMILKDETFAEAVSKYADFEALVPKVLYIMPIDLVELPDITVDPAKDPEIKKYYPIDVYVSYTVGNEELIARCRFSVTFTDYLDVAKPNNHKNYEEYVESVRVALTHRQILLSVVLSSEIPKPQQKAYAALIGDDFVRIDPYHMEITEDKDGTRQFTFFMMSYDKNENAYTSIVVFSAPNGYDSWDKIQTALATKKLATSEIFDLVVKTLRVNAAYKGNNAP